MAQDTIQKIINVQFKYDDLISGWKEASVAIDNAKKKLDEFKKEGDTGGIAKQTQLIKALRTEMNQYTREIQANVKEEVKAEGSINQLNARIAKLTAQYNAMAGEIRKSAAGEALAKEIAEVQTEVNKANEALLNFRNNVGNYASAAKGFTPLSFQVQQLAREIPSLTNSLQQFFLAISNNLPMFADELTRAKEANKALRAEGKATVPVFKQIASAIFSWQTALVVGITLLISYGKEIAEWAKGLFSANNAIAESAKYIKEFNSAIDESRLTLQQEFNALSNAQKGTAEYAAARKVILDKYGEYLSNQREEIRNLEDQKAAYDALAKSVTATAISKGLEESNAKATKDYGDALTKIFDGLQDKFIKKFGKEAGIEYFTQFRVGLTSQEKELRDKAEEIYNMFNYTEFEKGPNWMDTTMKEVQKNSLGLLVIEDVDKATRDYNETISSNKIAMESLMKIYGITTDDIEQQTGAVKDLVKQKEAELEAILAEAATTEEEVASRNKRAEAIENEIKRLRELGRENKKINEQIKLRNKEEKSEEKAAELQIKLTKKVEEENLKLAIQSRRKNEVDELLSINEDYRYQVSKTKERISEIEQLEKSAGEKRKSELIREKELLNSRLILLEQKYQKEKEEIDKKAEQQYYKDIFKQKEDEYKNRILQAQLSGGDMGARQEALNIAKAELEVYKQQLQDVDTFETAYRNMGYSDVEIQNMRLQARLNIANAENAIEQAQEQSLQNSIASVEQLIGALGGLAEASGASAELAGVLAIAQSAAAMGLALSKAFSRSATVWDAIAGAAAAIATITTVVSTIRSLGDSASDEGRKYRYAQGGLVTGPGSATSDSIPAMLSNGESVMTARATSEWGDLLSAINVSSGGNAINVSNLPQRGDGMRGMERMMERVMLKMPVPVVSVVDINKGQKRVKVSDNLGKLGRKK